MDVGKGREQDAVSFAYMDVGKGREQDAVSFAYMDVGKGREQDAVALRTQFSTRQLYKYCQLNDKPRDQLHIMLKKISCSFLLFFIAMALASCSGWRLRGSDGDIATLSQNSIYLSGNTSQTYQLIQQKLTKKNTLAHFTNAKQELALGKEQWERRSVSLSRNISTAEYELSLTVNYKILDNNQQLLRGPNDAVIVRSYTYDENDIAGKDKEEALIRKDMRRAIVRQILQQLELTQR